MKKIDILLNVNSNIIEQKKNLHTVTSVGTIRLGKQIGQYRLLHTEEVGTDNTLEDVIKKVAKLDYQAIADAFTVHAKVGTVVVLPPIITGKGILVNYNRIDRIYKKGKQFIAEYPEKNMLFLKIVV